MIFKNLFLKKNKSLAGPQNKSLNFYWQNFKSKISSTYLILTKF